MCCASAALPPLPQSSIFSPAVRASQIICPDRSMSLTVERKKGLNGFQVSLEGVRQQTMAGFGELLSTLLWKLA